MFLGFMGFEEDAGRVCRGDLERFQWGSKVEGESVIFGTRGCSPKALRSLEMAFGGTRAASAANAERTSGLLNMWGFGKALEKFGNGI